MSQQVASGVCSWRHSASSRGLSCCVRWGMRCRYSCCSITLCEAPAAAAVTTAAVTTAVRVAGAAAEALWLGDAAFSSLAGSGDSRKWGVCALCTTQHRCASAQVDPLLGNPQQHKYVLQCCDVCGAHSARMQQRSTQTVEQLVCAAVACVCSLCHGCCQRRLFPQHAWQQRCQTLRTALLCWRVTAAGVKQLCCACLACILQHSSSPAGCRMGAASPLLQPSMLLL